MTEERKTPSLNPARTIAIAVAALLAGSAIFVLFVLPAEFHRDPTGFGKLTGLDRVAGPEIVTVAAAPAGPNATTRFYATAFRTDTFEITLPPDEDKGELEFKVKMRPGDTLTYSWNVTGDEAHPEWFYYDFHGESRPVPEGAKATVMEYRQATGLKSSGALVAPFEGVHGWYFQNQSDKPQTVHLTISGFYELVPPGEYGNEGKVVPLAKAQG
ncbi:MAG TPA: hypothetical protein VHT51_12970 [Micropepsaceae bacterium]|jgi:hypothetical protein|nr:hypothetical protein [Micropepsaceae bacterium]